MGTADKHPAGANAKGPKSLAVTFEDNNRLAHLLGEHDQHLALIEERLGIEAVAHGNVVMLKGDRAACEAARDVLNVLYERLAGGDEIGPGDVDGAIRIISASGAGNGSEPEGGRHAQIRTRRRTITARSPVQDEYISAMARKDLVFSTGPAGTGKTYLAVAHAAARLEAGETDRIILSRPAVEAGERLGFLPGDMREKVDPYLRPLFDALYDVLPPEKVDQDLHTGIIEVAPLAFMRGRTLAHAIVILDEAQNCTPMQMKMFLTRLGEGSRMVVTGDPSQIDLPKGQVSGLNQAIGLLEGVEGIAHIAFTKADVVRHDLVTRIVEAYDSFKADD